MVHKITVEGIIEDIELKRIIVDMHNGSAIKNIIDTYGRINYVPFIGKTCVKIKLDRYNSKCKKTARVPHLELARYKNKICAFNVVVRKNVVENSTSISLLLEDVVVLSNCVISDEELLTSLNNTQA